MKTHTTYKDSHFTNLPVTVIYIDQQESMKLHDHGFHELVVITSGQGEHIAGDERYEIKAGDVFLLKPGTPHTYINTVDLKLINILYLPEDLRLPLYDLADSPGYHAFFELEPAMRIRHGFRSKLHVDSKQLEQITAITGEIDKISIAAKPGCRFKLAAGMMRLIGLLSDFYVAGDAPDREELMRLGNVISYIERNYTKELTLESLAKRASMSPSTLHRAFTTALGESPINYLISVRLAKAKEMLISSSLSITEISMRTGFRDSNYFSRIFKKRTGKSPREYRL